MVKRLRKWYYAFAFQGTAYGLISLVLSLFVVTALEGNVADASVAMAMFSLGNLGGSLFAGTFLDKHPHFFEVVFISAVADAVVLTFMEFTSSLVPYNIFSFVFGFFLSMMSPAMVTYLNKKFSEDVYRNEVSTLNLFNSTGITVGIFFGGAWLTLNFFKTNDVMKMKSIFVMSAVFFGISALFSAFYLKRKLLSLKMKSRKFSVNFHLLAGNVLTLPHNIISPFKMTYFKPETKRYMAGLFLIFFGANMFFTPFPIFLKKVLNVSSGYIFIIYGLNSAFANLAYLFTNSTMRKFRDMSIMSVVLWVRISMLGLVAASQFFDSIGLYLTLIAFMVIGFTWPFFYIPATIQATNLALPENKGKIMGMFNMVINLGAISASFVAGYVALKFGYLSSFIIGAFVLFAGDRILAKIARSHPIKEEYLRRQKRFWNGIIKFGKVQKNLSKENEERKL